ncbi:MAG TPA: BTAD domain-containing putative transcriptional regulator [Streptosporangiaceae bacterium]|nr:BTAD domain-containing putative transcriptional regulator [Streptosporangiaceae bacterium]
MTAAAGARSPAASSLRGVPVPRRSPTAAPGGPPPGGAEAIRIRLLGRFAVERDGQEIALASFGGRLARRLLRLLALQRGALVVKEQIADALWPGNPPADPAGNIEVLVSRLRRAMGDRALVRTGPGGYALADDDRCWVDAEAFLSAVQAGQAARTARPAERLASFRAALGIWRGEPLPEDTYADWAQAGRRLLSLAYLDALDGAATAALESAGAVPPAGEAAAWAMQATAAEPLRESSVLLLVRALAAAGDQAGALAAFDRYRNRLAAETGLDPTPQALEIRQRALEGQPARGQPASSRAARSARPHGSPPGPDPFLGREEECAAIAAAASGHGPRVVLVTGPGGIGKSALLAEAARRADVPVLAAPAFAPDQDEAWSLAGRLLRQAAALLPDLRSGVTGPEAAALRETVPGLAGVAATAESAVDEGTCRAFALQGAVGLVAAAARPRCLIAVDDLQWADPASLTVLGLLLRRLDSVSLAAAYGAGASTGFDPAEALGIPGDQVAGLTLGPLPAGLIRSLFSDQLLAEAVIRQAGRTPFTVTEVIAALARQGKITRDSAGKWRLRQGGDAAGAAQAVAAGIGQAAGNRLTGLPSRWRDMLALIVLLGRPAPPALLAAASGSGQRAALDTLEGLGSAGLACPGPRGWWIRHGPVRQAVTAAVTPAAAARFHALLAEALRQCGADPAETARHLAASGDHDHAATAYAAAARSQLERIRDREAIRLADAGLALSPPGRARAALLEARAEARRRAGQLTAARADLTAALDDLDDPAFRSQVLAQLAILDARTADAACGSGLAALAIAEAGGQPAALGQALAAGAIIDLAEGNLARARHRARRAARLLDQAGDSRGSARLLYWHAMECFTAGRLRDAADQLDRLVRLAVTPGEVMRLWSPRATRGHVLALLGRAADGLAEIGETLAWARSARHPAVEAECLWHRAEALAALGRAAEAIDAAEQAAGIAARIGHAEWAAAAHRGLGIACEAAGLTGRADSAYRSSLQAAEGLPLFRAWAAARLGASLARQGRPGEAAPHVQAALAGGTPLTRHEARWAQAELLASQGDSLACAATAAAALDRARHDGYLVLVPRLRELADRWHPRCEA